MAYSPVQIVPQYHVDGVPASGYVLKAYQAGTSTLLQMATDSSGGALVNTITLNSQGYPSVSGNIVVPHLNAAYKLALYASQAAADANSGPIWIPDNLTPSSIVANIDISGNTISSTNTNGDITLDPNGSGEINLNATTNITAANIQTLDAETLQIDSVEVTASAAELNILDGVTSSAAELNILDGVTATATEINIAADNSLTGSYTGTAVGLATNPTVTINYRKIGPVVILESQATLTGTSNSTAFSVTGAPAGIRPVATTGQSVVQISDNGTAAGGTAIMDTSGVLQLARINGSAWTNSGTKAIFAFIITYIADV